ncbi:MAG: hypothetical protein HS104_41115 [Polyangiaceae bacterium]|nr:hypothetical protein [Polyangiaceae bacterium]MCL4752132.1 hypothetical protein [Myxococcales bacterium]
MRWVVPALLLFAACAPPPSTNKPAHVEVAKARPAAAEAVPPPSAHVRPVVVSAKAALVPDASCFDRSPEERRLLGFRALPDLELEATFWLVAEAGVCKSSTHARAELFLAKSESLEQIATCGAWRVEACVSAPLHAALPNPPHREVRDFERTPDWQGMDSQSDGLGERRRETQITRVPGSSLTLLHTRAGYVALHAGEKRVDAFWAKAFVLVDGVAHLVTSDAMVRLADPPEYLPLPSLHTSERPPEPRLHPFERQN